MKILQTGAQLSRLNEQRSSLLRRKQELENGDAEKNREQLEKVSRELDRVDFQYKAASESAKGENEAAALSQALDSSNKQCEAMARSADDQAKCMEIARRLSRGDKVPMKDEQKLLEFNFDMYQMAKSMGAMAHNEKPKKHKSLWEDEEEPSAAEQFPDVTESGEISAEMPAPVEAADLPTE